MRDVRHEPVRVLVGPWPACLAGRRGQREARLAAGLGRVVRDPLAERHHRAQVVVPGPFGQLGGGRAAAGRGQGLPDGEADPAEEHRDQGEDDPDRAQPEEPPDPAAAALARRPSGPARCCLVLAVGGAGAGGVVGPSGRSVRAGRRSVRAGGAVRTGRARTGWARTGRGLRLGLVRGPYGWGPYGCGPYAGALRRPARRDSGRCTRLPPRCGCEVPADGLPAQHEGTVTRGVTPVAPANILTQLRRGNRHPG